LAEIVHIWRWGGAVSKPELSDRTKRGLRGTSAVWRSRGGAVLLLLLSLGRPLATRGQESEKKDLKDLSQLSLEELMNLKVDTVYGASKFEQKVTEAPSSVTIITADEIQKYGYRTVSDLLQSVPGFYVTNDRNYSYIGVEGISRPTDYNTRPRKAHACQIACCRKHILGCPGRRRQSSSCARTRRKFGNTN